MLSSTGRYSRGNFESPGDRLNTINELNSTGSLLASFDLTTERTEEELELSVMRSSRPARAKRTSEGLGYNPDNSKRYKTNREVTFGLLFYCAHIWRLTFLLKNVMEVSGNERLIATTTVTVSKGGPVTAKSTIENVPESSGESDEGTMGHVTPRNPRKRSSSEPGIIPNAPPQCKFRIIIYIDCCIWNCC